MSLELNAAHENEITNRTHSDFLEFVRSEFTQEELGIFKESFFLTICSGYDVEKDFVVDLDDVWETLGFSNKHKAVELLKKHFNESEHYLLTQLGEQLFNGGAGMNKKSYKMTINTFKKLCLKANTKTADKIHDYYIKLETTFMKYTKNELEKRAIIAEHQERERHLLEKFKDKSGVYFLINPFLKLMKFGSSGNVTKRIRDHKKGAFRENFYVDHVVETHKYNELENTVRKHKNTTFGTQTEIVQYNDYNEVSVIYRECENNSRMIGPPEYSTELEIELSKERQLDKQLSIELSRERQLYVTNNLPIPDEILDLPESVMLRTQNYKEEQNEYVDWIRENLKKEPGNRISLSEICEAFKTKMSKHEKTRLKRYIEKEFDIECNQIKITGKNTRGFEGINLRELKNMLFSEIVE